MREWVRQLVWRISDSVLEKRARRIFAGETMARKGDHRRFVLMSVSGHGNLGDDAMLTALVQSLRARGENDITILLHHDRDRSDFGRFDARLVSVEGYFDKRASKKALLRLHEALVGSTDLIIIGADVVDGRYFAPRSWRRLFMGELAAIVGLDVSLVGFSFSDRAAPRIKAYLRETYQNYRICARDPVSAKRVGSVLGREISSGADLAFLLETPATLSPPAAPAETKIQEWRAENRLVLAFNCNPIGVKNANKEISLEDAAANYAVLLDTLAEDGRLAFLLLTHDNRWPNSDRVFMQDILARTTRLDDTNSLFIAPTLHASDMKRLCSLVDFTFTGRMHLSIASLGTGTPAMPLNYQGKVEGLLMLLGIPTLGYEVSEILDPTQMAERLKEAIGNRSIYSDEIRKNLPSVHQLANNNLDVVLN